MAQQKIFAANTTNALKTVFLCFFLMFLPALSQDRDSAKARDSILSSTVNDNNSVTAGDSLLLSNTAISTTTPSPTPPPPSLMARFNNTMAGFLFLDLSFGKIKVDKVDRNNQPILVNGVPEKRTIGVPLIVALLFFGSLFFTFWYKWINIRGFKHGIEIVMGHFDRPEDKGEISHFRALTSALSATVGLGNIAGVAIAIQIGGPGAVLWMLLAALIGMSEKFSSCTLAQMYRRVNKDGSISGGPMYYLDLGFKSKGPKWAVFGKVLAISFAVMTILGAIGGGNMFQVNQSVEAIQRGFNLTGNHSALGIGIIFCIFTGSVILGGIKRIGQATSKLVPFMVALYVGASLYIIAIHIADIPAAAALIFRMAFSEHAYYGGIVGVIVWGIKRAHFSNEAGLGSSSIAHAAAKTDEPVREGLVGMMEPFIDTIIVCFMTALVVILTGVWQDPNIPQEAGVTLTMVAFESVISWYPYVLTGCIVLFAYSTVISWCYYGERAWIYLLDHFNGMGHKTLIVFRIIYLAFILVGAVNTLSDVLLFTDLMILSMAYPNLIGSILLAPKVKEVVDDYWHRYASGKMVRVK